MHPLDAQALDAQAAPAGLQPGQILDGKYKVLGELGRGAMGVVYRGLHTALDRPVAIKTLRQEFSNDADLANRFEREARAASAIGHPHIIDVFDLGRTPEGLLFMVMELLDGKALGQVLEEQHQLPIPIAVDIISQVLGGLSAAHKNGIVHRDLKPDNIFLVHNEDHPHFVKIVDFGIAKQLTSRGRVNPKASTGTLVGTVMGTPLYMAPEQAIGRVESIDNRTDLYAAGVVLYEMLCGRTPYQGDDFAVVMGALLEGKYPLPRSLRPEIPVSIEAAIVRALDRDMAKRFPNAAAMREAITGSERTPTPVTVGTLGDASAPLTLAALDGPNAAISLVEDTSRVQPARPARRALTDDRFAPPPAHEVPLQLDGTRWGSSIQPGVERPDAAAAPGKPAARRDRDQVQPDEPVPQLARRPRPAAPQGTLEPDRIVSRRARPLLIKAGAVVGVLLAARVGYSFWKNHQSADSAVQSASGSISVALELDPTDATVQVDHIPTTKRELSLEAGVAHVLNATAPGRITRRFGFDAKPGLKLSVRLGRALDVPAPGAPPPSTDELNLAYPDSARPAKEIEAAFSKLDSYFQCLTGADDSPSRPRRLRGEDLAQCQDLIRQARSRVPAMPGLEAAADTFVAAVQGGQKLDTVARAQTAFRAQALAARALWQQEELALEEARGRKAGWHMRRLTLAALSWQRAIEASPAAPEMVDERVAALDQAHREFLDYAQAQRQEMARTSGANDFIKAAEDTLALAHKPRNPIAVLAACRRLVSAFNALAIE